MIKSETMDIKISDKIFYDRFPFKIVVEGNSWNHDATRLEELNDYIYSHIEYPWMEMQQVPVSYTHLTLPTICSV